MAGGWSRDGSVQEQFDASIEDEVRRARNQLPAGESLHECEACDTEIPEGRRLAIPGVRLCVKCQEIADNDDAVSTSINRRGSKDSQLR